MQVGGGFGSLIGGGGKKITASKRISMLMKDLNRASQTVGAARKLQPLIPAMDNKTLETLAVRPNVAYDLANKATAELQKRGAETTALVAARASAGLPTLPAPAGLPAAAVAQVRAITQDVILRIQNQAYILKNSGLSWTEAQWAAFLGVASLTQSERDLINASIAAANAGYQFAAPPQPVQTPSGSIFPDTTFLAPWGDSDGDQYADYGDQYADYGDSEYPSDELVNASYDLYTAPGYNVSGLGEAKDLDSSTLLPVVGMLIAAAWILGGM